MHTCTCVAIVNLKEIKDALGYFSDWNSLGLNLGLHPRLLEVISVDRHSVQDRQDEVLRNWLSKNYIDRGKEPTWSQLVAAIEPINPALSMYISK